MSKDYSIKIEKELEHYRHVETIHDLPDIQHYVNHSHLRPLLQSLFPFGSFEEMVVHYFQKLRALKGGEPLEVLSLGSGNCELEIALLADYGLDCRISCFELNPEMLDRAAEKARSKQVANRVRLVRCDINELELDYQYDLVLAYYALHHFVELERIFDVVAQHMTENSIFLVGDMIGRNGHLFWDATLDLCNRLWSVLPNHFKYNHLIREFWPVRKQWDCSLEGFEGIRAQEILPLLDERFSFQDFAPFYSLVNRFTDRDFGPNFSVEDPMSRNLIDFIWLLDHYCCQNQLLKPTQMLACLTLPPGADESRRFLYFETPSDLYNLDDSRLYDHFSAVPASARLQKAGTPNRARARRAGGWRTRRRR